MPVTAPAEAVFTIHQIDKIVHWFNYLPFKQACSLDPLTAELYREVLAPEVLHAQVAEHFFGLSAGACTPA